MAYRVRLTDRVRLQLHDAPPQLQGFVAGIIAFLLVDPSAASVVFEEQQLVVIDELTWLP